MEYRRSRRIRPQGAGARASAPARSAAQGPLFSAWGNTDVAEARRLVDICLEAGVNLFDTADVYSDGASEEVLGAGDQGPARRGPDLDQDRPADGRRAERCRLLAPPPDRAASRRR